MNEFILILFVSILLINANNKDPIQLRSPVANED